MLPGFFPVNLPNPSQPELTLYIGTYTSAEGSKGIYRMTMDSVTGELKAPTLVAETPNPSYLAIDGMAHFLFSVNELDKGTVSAFAIGPASKLTYLNKQSSLGSAPCHLSLGSDQKSVFVANYGDGTLARLPIKPDGSLEPANWVFSNKGSGPNKGRQEGPHAHAVYTTKNHRITFTCDLGTDELLLYVNDPKHQGQVMVEPHRVKLQPGSGPRHAAMNPNGKFIYVCGELDNQVSVLQCGEGEGWKVVQMIGTLPDGVSVSSSNTAEIMCHPSGQWVYVSNRGHDSIAVYATHPNGHLSLIEIHKLGVHIPRGFDIDPSGRWLVVGGQTSNDLVALEIDPHSGKLRQAGHPVPLGSPVSVLFSP